MQEDQDFEESMQMNRAAATCMRRVCKIWPLSGYNATRAKKETSQETKRSLQKFFGSNPSAKVIYADNSFEFGKAFEDLKRNHFTSTRQNGIAERAANAVLLQFGLDLTMVGRFHGMLLLSAHRSGPLIGRENSI